MEDSLPRAIIKRYLLHSLVPPQSAIIPVIPFHGVSLVGEEVAKGKWDQDIIFIFVKTALR